jgi:L-malate glycosyltransferase
MKIGIYREFTTESAGLGGAEFCVAALAEAFEERHDVDIIHNIRALTRERIGEYFGIELRRTRFRFEQGDPLLCPELKFQSRLPWKKYREAAMWRADLSKPYDLFICFIHHVPPFCHARYGVLIVLFPFFNRTNHWPWREVLVGRRPRPILATHKAVYKWMWAERFRSYTHRYAISEYTRWWTKRWWNVDCDVLYPPVNIRSRPLDKQPLILSIGRFDRTKQHLDMVKAFALLARAGLGDWSYRCVGGLDDSMDQQSYFDQVRTAAGSLPIQLSANPSRADVESSLGSARIFWHAMGYGKDDEAEPFFMEHFGIATVEAMAWGCVPVVVNRGGQPEIVRHGIDGFVWDTLEELEHYTRLLMSDNELRDKMSESARLRAQTFDKQRFVKEVADRCKISLANT